MGAKLASRSTGMAKKEVIVLTDEQMIAIVRSHTAANLPVLNSEYVAAFIRAYDALAASLSTPATISEDAPNANETGLTAAPQSDSIGQ